ENCFEYNCTSSKRPLYIQIRNTEDGYIEVRNNIQPKLRAIESRGDSLDLLTRRYRLMGIPAGILREKFPDQFSVKLRLIP
ncbi:MAG: sensor protein lytS, partial [Bacteroidota bacterium]